MGTKERGGHYRGVAISVVWYNVHVHGLIDSVYDKRICNYMYMYNYRYTCMYMYMYLENIKSIGYKNGRIFYTNGSQTVIGNYNC